MRADNGQRNTPALGLGLPLIAALSDGFELRGSSGAGTEVSMTFAYVRDRDPVLENPITGTLGEDGRWESDDDLQADAADGDAA